MLMPNGLTPQEIRVLQEYRRIAADEMTVEQIVAIRHPVGGGEAPAWSLAEKGYLVADEARQKLSLTEEAKAFLAYDPVP